MSPRIRFVACTLIAPLLGCAAGASAPESSASPAVGTERGGVVAVAADAATRPLTYLAGSLDDAEVLELGALAPGVRLVSGLTRETALEHAAGAWGADAHLVTPELLAAAPQLAWVQAWSAGVERYLAIEGFADADFVFTNMKGVHGPVIAEHAFALLLSLTRQLRVWDEGQGALRWERSSAETTQLSGRTMLVVGLGGIGREVALRAHAFGMRVLATEREPGQPPAYVDLVGGADDLDALLTEADVVAICVPLTPETEGLFDARRLALLRPGAYLINIARGKIVDTDALLAALESGHLAGACLDVTDPEPLPDGHPLWARSDVVITPHVAGRGELTEERRRTLFRENLQRFGRGEPLLNVVDKAAGY